MTDATRKPRVFLASTFIGLEEERTALLKLFSAYEDKIDFWGYPWSGADPAIVSARRARESDFFFLILAGRYGTKDPRTDLGITELEYLEFLYTHAVEYTTQQHPTPVLHIFEKHPANIGPEVSDLPDQSESLIKFRSRINSRHTLLPPFRDWRELQVAINRELKLIPATVPDKSYSKATIHQFDFEVLGIGHYRENQVRSKWAECECPVFKAGGCEYQEKLHYRPPPALENEMQRHLTELWSDPSTPPIWRQEQPSFKTISIREVSDRNELVFEFCWSTWHQFLGTNQGATKDGRLRRKLKKAGRGIDLSKSPFSNNLGIAIAVIDSQAERVYWTLRSKQNQVSIHPGLRSTAVGTQLHGFDQRHFRDGVPDVFAAARTELFNEAHLNADDIRDLYVTGWGIGTRTGTPEVLLVCDTSKPLAQILKDVQCAIVPHAAEFDRIQMVEDKPIWLDYELVADFAQHSDGWEPEAAVATCLALNVLSPNCVSFKK